ncbi:hypothetical protein BG006_000709 [Podila minutissima]|uniref:Histone H1 n=1 Tax=Podila minutissima TaxID=64525 RepID=A0A9P5SQE0_9FUNG|nr:hypothetical protein BG006_000709 [Podila minutissima]
MSDSHSSRSKRGKSRRPLHNSIYDSEALKSQGSRHGQGNPNERGTGGATNLHSGQDLSNTRITDPQDDIPSRASSLGGSSANNMNHAQPNELEGHGGESQHERTFDMQSTANDHMEQPRSGPISLSMGALGPKPEETCKPQDGDHGFEVDTSIQQSTIMMKRLRSKSESKISGAKASIVQDTTQDKSSKGTDTSGICKTIGCVLCYTAFEAVGNNIVICDKCSRRFHQLCYSSTIDNRFIEARELEWHCFACSPLGTTAQEHTSVAEDMTLTSDQVPKSVKESYLWAMHKADLISRTCLGLFKQAGKSKSLPSPKVCLNYRHRLLGWHLTILLLTVSQQRVPYQEQHKKSGSTGKEITESTTISTGSNYNSVKALDLPPYEEMIFMAIADLREDAGSAPKAILDWVHDHYPVPDTFRASCGQAISKAAKKGRLVKDGALYKLKPGYNYPPKRLPRHTGGPRARSLSYNSGLPLSLQPLSRPMTNKPNINSSGFESMDMMMDTNVYNMLPSSQFQVQQAMVAPFTPDGMVASSGQANHAHPFKIGKPLVGDTEMVEALAVQPSLIGGNMSSDPKLVGLGVTSMNSLKQDARSNFVLGQEMAPASFDTATVTARYSSLESGRIHPFVIRESLDHQSNIDAQQQPVLAVLTGVPAPEPSNVHHDADPILAVHVYGSGSTDTDILDPFDDHISACTGHLPTAAASVSAPHDARADE